ncbi:MAG TPA: ferredoxin [Candidatus Magasanikbacteria bacterium]|mgnify:CR=1 FL=1|jgi:ferredoxin|nr:ferredoxin [Candidatus Magasanikbacteria bacterium]NLZ97031.1 ferredoxin [Candidatus Magasanikbacteria bacterium]HQF57291.1 ferredoxin [Candidatus Magasanikbacteria bacterium]HQL52537.1 ferredoxin [Candidatus Magasanikbacteria bacterium]
MSKIKIDQEKCVGCGSCSYIWEENIKMNEENKAEIIDSSLELEEDKIQDLIDSCPVGVIEKE